MFNQIILTLASMQYLEIVQQIIKRITLYILKLISSHLYIFYIHYYEIERMIL